MQQRHIPSRRHLAGVAVLGLCLAGGNSAQAQNNPGNGPNGGPNNVQRADYRNLTAEQRQHLMQQVRDFTRAATIRLMLENAGFKDQGIQDNVVAFATAQETAMQPLRDRQRQLMQTLFDQGVTVTQQATLLNDFRGDIEDEVTRRKTALTDLDAKINYTKQPRLAAVLTTMGLLGDEMDVVGEPSVLDGGMGGRGGPGVFGGPGGGFGGFGGGPGGPGGGGVPGSNGPRGRGQGG